MASLQVITGVDDLGRLAPIDRFLALMETSLGLTEHAPIRVA